VFSLYNWTFQLKSWFLLYKQLFHSHIYFTSIKLTCIHFIHSFILLSQPLTLLKTISFYSHASPIFLLLRKSNYQRHWEQKLLLQPIIFLIIISSWFIYF
jgi:hypothetical protein